MSLKEIGTFQPDEGEDPPDREKAIKRLQHPSRMGRLEAYVGLRGVAEGARSGYTARMLRAVIFDMDGLLFDTERLCCDAWREVAAEAGYEMRDELFRSCVGRNSRDTREMVMAECGPSFPYDEFNDRVRVRMRGLMAKDGPPETGVRAFFSF
jgi:hypothetical protein